MDRASERVSAVSVLGAAALSVIAVLPLSGARASTSAGGGSLFSPGLGCGPAETSVDSGGLLARVRADAAAPQHRRGAGAALGAGRRGAQKPAPLPASPRSAQKAPAAEPEPRAAVLRSFYTCESGWPAEDLTQGTGWRLVGPLRRA